MKLPSLLSNLAMASVICLVPVAHAEEGKDGGEKTPQRPGGGRAELSSEDRVKMMTERLGLTQDQQTKVREIFVKNEPALKELMAKGTAKLSAEERQKMMDLLKSQREAIEAVLTPEQKAKMAERKPIRGGRGGNAVGPVGAGPRKVDENPKGKPAPDA